MRVNGRCLRYTVDRPSKRRNLHLLTNKLFHSVRAFLVLSMTWLVTFWWVSVTELSEQHVGSAQRVLNALFLSAAVPGHLPPWSTWSSRYARIQGECSPSGGISWFCLWDTWCSFSPEDRTKLALILAFETFCTGSHRPQRRQGRAGKGRRKGGYRNDNQQNIVSVLATLLIWHQLLFVGWLWSTWATWYSWNCGSAGELKI